MTHPVTPTRTLAVLLTLLVAFGPICTDLYLASWPDLARDFKTDTAMVQMTLASFVSGFAVMQLGYGPLSDRFGRRRTLMGGVFLYVAASIFCVFAPTIEALILGRFVQALGACCGPVVSRAVVRDIFPREQAAKVMSYMASAMALAPLVAPTIGGWFHSWFGWRSNFVLLALFGVGLLGMVWRLLDETNRHPDPTALDLGRMIGNYGTLLRDRVFIGYTLTLTVIFAGVFVYLSSIAFILIDAMGLEPRYFGFGFSLASVGYIIGGFIAARVTHRVGIERMVGLGVIGCTLAGALMAGLAWAGFAKPGLEGLASVLLPVMVFFVFAALVLPNATAGAIAPFPQMAGTASAAIGFTQMAGGAGIGWLAGLAFDGSARPMTTAMALLGLVAAVVFFSLVKPAAKP
ncbi:Bcr/CflA family drug resistance efflux transporter [Paramagnetospirillum kuznetsovii]|uniref:Bcr/CflA family efflux transporter n=1 Tax=Paramagnetospirillum kuznetsovii TaxID=2053833 RepID=A0A364P124_9PROT|nr:multidrug effflux MFS transporter [Paramagnetospirillum kuznetsovii]RAU22857.1 Bcr/CflA family drug resistance efflux transporter [Paramagnetospirillum kuznetsovii]